MHRIFLLIITALLSVAGVAPAQSGIGDALIFTGLTTTSGADTYAWLSWQPTAPAVLSGRVVAVYRKNGGAGSASPFTRLAVIEPASNTQTVNALLPLSQKVGEDLPDLTMMLHDLLGDATLANNITLAAQINALLSAARTNSEQARRLDVLALQHPALALCAGRAHADLLPGAGVVTYELRDFDKEADKDNGVIGRVTLNPATPFVLPAPGAPVEVPDASPKGHLNATLRWATPNALRDVAPLHHGFNLYRVPKSVAESHGWDVTAPTIAALTAEAQTRRVNDFAILPPKLLTAVEAANLTDATTFFAIDDNNRFRPGGALFTDDTSVYYFVAARNTLGHPGQPSAGTLVRILDHVAPNPPRNTRVRNVASYNGTVRDQRFLIEWDAPVLPPGETVSAWYVYRWRTPHEIPSKAAQLDPVTGKPERNLIAILPAGTLQFTDDGTVAPPAWAIVDEPAPDAGDLGKTYYYTVRASDGSVSQNISGNSAPAWGVLRDRKGPLPGGAVGGGPGPILTTSFGPSLTFTSFTQVPLVGLTKDQAHYVLTCDSAVSRGLDWAEFRRSSPQGIVPLGRARFAKNAAGNLVALLRSTILDYSSDRPFECRIGTTSGAVSVWVASPNAPDAMAGNFILAKWNAGLSASTADGTLTGWRHDATNPLTGAATDVCGTFLPTVDAKEYRIYRRVNDGVQTLVTQGATTLPTTLWKDTSQLAASATVEYYLQTLDANSNPSALVTQGAPLTVIAALPTPMLEPLKSLLPITNTKMRVKWFCTTAGVERFEIWVARKSGALAASTGSGLSADLATHLNMDTSVAETAGLDFAVFQTGLARHLSVGGTPEFEADLPVSASDTYTVMIRAVGPGEYSARAVGAFSNVGTFSYSLTHATLNNPVPWPERALPPRADFHPGIAATYLGTTKLAPWNGNAVRIGEYEDATHDASNTVTIYDPQDTGHGPLIYALGGTRAPTFYLYTNDGVALDELKETNPGSVLPVALYRVQIANTAFPNVPGDIVQVSPLMEQIAYITYQGEVAVTDPFIAVLHKNNTDLPRTAANFDHDILLLDRQPVIKGARYKYLLVRFTPGKEIERVIVTNTVDVPN